MNLAVLLYDLNEEEKNNIINVLYGEENGPRSVFELKQNARECTRTFIRRSSSSNINIGALAAPLVWVRFGFNAYRLDNGFDVSDGFSSARDLTSSRREFDNQLVYTFIFHFGNVLVFFFVRVQFWLTLWTEWH